MTTERSGAEARIADRIASFLPNWPATIDLKKQFGKICQNEKKSE
jgi:hypothetical protein